MVFSIICEAALNSAQCLKLNLNKPPLSTLHFVDNDDTNILHAHDYLVEVLVLEGKDLQKIGNSFYFELFFLKYSNISIQQNTSLAGKSKLIILFLVKQNRLYKSV